MPLARASTDEFHHSPLQGDNIRLPEIRPGVDFDEVSCRACIFAVEEGPKYAAIPYRWGSTSDPDRMSIRINSKGLEIMPNAYWAILYQRSIGKWRYVWMIERNHQVALMGRIFSHAAQVFIWLGYPDPAIHLALEVLRSAFLHTIEQAPTGKTPIWRVELQKLNPLFRLEYWSRIWIIQEILFASSLVLMCGDQTRSWESLAAIIDLTHVADLSGHGSIIKRLVRQRRKVLSQGVDSLGNPFRSLRAAVGNAWYTGIEQLLQECSQSQCHDQRDKIYGVLEIWKSQSASAPFEVDYSRSVEDLLLVTYAYVLEHSPNPRYPVFCKTLQQTLCVEPSSLLWRELLSHSSKVSHASSNEAIGYAFKLSNAKTLTVPPLSWSYKQWSTITAVGDSLLAKLEDGPWVRDHIRELMHPGGMSSLSRERDWEHLDQTGQKRIFCDTEGGLGLALYDAQAGDQVCLLRGFAEPRVLMDLQTNGLRVPWTDWQDPLCFIRDGEIVGLGLWNHFEGSPEDQVSGYIIRAQKLASQELRRCSGGPQWAFALAAVLDINFHGLDYDFWRK